MGKEETKNENLNLVRDILEPMLCSCSLIEDSCLVFLQDRSRSYNSYRHHWMKWTEVMCKRNLLIDDRN